jgi:hypothetical protein
LPLRSQYLRAGDSDRSPGTNRPGYCASLSGDRSVQPTRFLESWAIDLPISCRSRQEIGICLQWSRESAGGGQHRGKRTAILPAKLCASMSPVFSLPIRLSAFQETPERMCMGSFVFCHA